ncbi:30S ribosomal protein S6 alpha, chloroplastic [Rhodamnia argentea]|uniref:30S ribosomal protein S6 alpha, chloroplastic n=1 Tax=Rhodamnia argentea TaxID=178133 RepID=A0A8B8P613_9MYRT|nr:30S ribosomal protein S6 alpha, chloroplastic [Rhodamnia argentea]
MASSSLASTLKPPSTSPFCPYPPSKLSSPLLSFSHTLKPFPSQLDAARPHRSRRRTAALAAPVRAQTLDFSGTFFEGGLGSEDDPASPPGSGSTAVEDREELQCPPGLRQYETMAVLRPDMSEDERLALTQRYEELLVAGGGMYVEVFNRGVIPLAYSIKKKNKAGESNTYLDGIYLLFTYFTKPESTANLEGTLNADDDVIRSSTFKIRKRKY